MQSTKSQCPFAWYTVMKRSGEGGSGKMIMAAKLRSDGFDPLQCRCGLMIKDEGETDLYKNQIPAKQEKKMWRGERILQPILHILQGFLASAICIRTVLLTVHFPLWFILSRVTSPVPSHKRMCFSSMTCPLQANNPVLYMCLCSQGSGAEIPQLQNVMKGHKWKATTLYAGKLHAQTKAQG